MDKLKDWKSKLPFGIQNHGCGSQSPRIYFELEEIHRKMYDSVAKAIDDATKEIENKIEKANNTGLDQVCLTEVLEDQKIFQNADFLNLDSLLDFSSKGENDSKIWVLVGKTKRSLEDSYLYSKYKNYFKEEQQ